MNTNAQFRAVIFDVDGTLFDTLPSLSAAANSVLALVKLQEIPASILRKALNHGLEHMFREAIALQTPEVGPTLATELENEFLQEYRHRWLTQAPLYAHLNVALVCLRDMGLKLGICTNRDRSSTEVLLAQSCIDDYFEVIVGMGDAPHPKPAPDPILIALDHLGVAAHEVLFVGDSAVDALCARQAQVGFSAHLAGYCEQAGDLLPNVFSFNNYAEFTRRMFGENSSTSAVCHA